MIRIKNIIKEITNFIKHNIIDFFINKIKNRIVKIQHFLTITIPDVFCNRIPRFFSVTVPDEFVSRKNKIIEAIKGFFTRYFPNNRPDWKVIDEDLNEICKHIWIWITRLF